MGGLRGNQPPPPLQGLWSIKIKRPRSGLAFTTPEFTQATLGPALGKCLGSPATPPPPHGPVRDKPLQTLTLWSRKVKNQPDLIPINF